MNGKPPRSEIALARADKRERRAWVLKLIRGLTGLIAAVLTGVAAIIAALTNFFHSGGVK